MKNKRNIKKDLIRTSNASIRSKEVQKVVYIFLINIKKKKSLIEPSRKYYTRMNFYETYGFPPLVPLFSYLYPRSQIDIRSGQLQYKINTAISHGQI